MPINLTKAPANAKPITDTRASKAAELAADKAQAVAKPRKPKPAPTATVADAKPSKPKPAPKPKPTAAETKQAQAAQAAVTTSRGLARDAATVTAQATFYKQYSDRDTAYLAFFGGVMRANGGKATLAQIHDAGTDAGKNKKRNPRYAGSAKATDAGAINRLIKAGYITASGDGNTLTATKAATTTAAYNGKA